MTPQFTPTMTGLATPEPLKFAFTAKTSAHASRGGAGPLTLDAAGWQAWWQRPSEAQERALYIHVPFCRKRCSFCNFFENGANPARMSRYMAALCDSLHRAADSPFGQSHPFSAVYVGGGTPTDMAADDLARLAEAIRRFPLTADAEVTLEGRLNGFDDEKWQTALAGGFNRFSFGVQSFNTEVRQQAARFDDRETLLARLGDLTRDDAAVIVADLIFGLPGQDDALWRQDIADVMTSGVHGVDLYQLIPMQGTNLERAQEKGRLGWSADGQQRATMYAYGARTLEQGGLAAALLQPLAAKRGRAEPLQPDGQARRRDPPLRCGGGGQHSWPRPDVWPGSRGLAPGAGRRSASARHGDEAQPQRAHGRPAARWPRYRLACPRALAIPRAGASVAAL